mmetsp:Transcript_8221/g.24215  ORF Transcript_8221/g.24215 Transcript_8221/m.24215 type:complete len:317 (-) Transcript_8221:2-952(-)
MTTSTAAAAVPESGGEGIVCSNVKNTVRRMMRGMSFAHHLATALDSGSSRRVQTTSKRLPPALRRRNLSNWAACSISFLETLLHSDDRLLPPESLGAASVGLPSEPLLQIWTTCSSSMPLVQLGERPLLRGDMVLGPLGTTSANTDKFLLEMLVSFLSSFGLSERTDVMSTSFWVFLLDEDTRDTLLPERLKEPFVPRLDSLLSLRFLSPRPCCSSSLSSFQPRARISERTSRSNHLTRGWSCASSLASQSALFVVSFEEHRDEPAVAPGMPGSAQPSCGSSGAAIITRGRPMRGRSGVSWAGGDHASAALSPWHP